jgi:hypothetical protein
MEAVAGGLSLPLVVLIIILAFRFNKAIKSVANIVDTKVSAVSAELTAEIVEDINNIDVDIAKIEKAQATIKALNSIKF